jgi:hypothetical protein
MTACGSSSPAPDAAIDASADAVDKSAACADTFGSALTDAFGRLDGTVLAIVSPGNQTCAQPNSTHVVVQLTMNGAAYRMVANIDVLTAELDEPLAGPAWSEGWHTDAPLDYATTLSVASSTFSTPADPVAFITDRIDVGARLSIYATSSGGTKADSAHLIHRNVTDADGAIVLTPDTAPHYLLFRFDNQSF